MLKRFGFSSALVLALAAASPAAAVTLQYSGTFTAEGGPGATGSGSALVTFDMDSLTMRVEASFSGLSGTTTASHIHCCTTAPNVAPAGVATVVPSFTNFPLGVSSGAYDFTYDMTQTSSFNGSFVTNNGGTAASALSALLAGLDDDRAYFNIHTSTFAGGEIRAFLHAVPEPGAATLLLLSLGLLGLRSARREG